METVTLFIEYNGHGPKDMQPFIFANYKWEQVQSSFLITVQ